MDTDPVADLIRFGDGGSVPNNPDLPVVLVRRALPGAGAAGIRAHFEAMGWTGTWTSVVFGFHHFHPDAHEALCVASGWGDILLGGRDGQVVRLAEGDLVVLPAGTGHCRVGASADFAICGAYPPGQENYALLRETEGARGRYGAEIAGVPVPESDPVFGEGGPLVEAWGAPGVAR